MKSPDHKAWVAKQDARLSTPKPDPALIDLEAYKERWLADLQPATVIDGKEKFVEPDGLAAIRALIAAVEALRERVAELDMELNAQQMLEALAKSLLIDAQAAQKSAEAHAVELAGALGAILDYGMLSCPPSMAKRASAALATLPAEALERSRARDEVVRLARCCHAGWADASGQLGKALAKLDALKEADPC